ncbi:hypothetical protein MIND_00335800 [Mycena indigotica]|uniref:Uncharacterized protein n=1 Tax=Mycena indigotica TaxID=2126181 RepID=A0A8H6W9F3_9AGAR|nr:uncharacterized protein MIND_00335800 [Mycena indigotica]KAF7309647.1 hypothetical protein MIND_00335800 [Mycena indigotica]
MSALNISLESHLHETVAPLHSLLPDELATQLAPFVLGTPPSTIPHSLLLSISKWSRSSDGISVLRAASLDPQSYTMIALLAGTTTSPERKLPAYIPDQSPQDVAAARKAERKAITTLVNALLSVFGSGFAAWWAADKTGWKYEWRVLFALGVAIVVAVAEAGLFLIWESRHSKKLPKRKLEHSSKKREQLQPPIDPSPVEHDGAYTGLRQRTQVLLHPTES